MSTKQLDINNSQGSDYTVKLTREIMNRLMIALEYMNDNHVQAFTCMHPSNNTMVHITIDNKDIDSGSVELLNRYGDGAALMRLVIDPKAITSNGEQLPLPINWDAVQLHTSAVKHYFIPGHQSTASVCEVCGQSELSSIHVTRKEYAR